MKLLQCVDIKRKAQNNRFNLTKPLSRLVLFASLSYARSAPSPSGAVFQVKRMLGGRTSCAIRSARLSGATVMNKIHLNAGLLVIVNKSMVKHCLNRVIKYSDYWNYKYGCNEFIKQ